MKIPSEKQSDELISDPFFENIFINLPVATVLFSNQLEVLQYNQSFVTFFQLPNADNGFPVGFEGLHSSFWQKTDVQQYLQFVQEDKTTFNEKIFDWQHEDGSFKYVQVQSQLLHPAAQSSAMLLLTFSDVSASKQIEKEHNERIRHIMHELRNPLSNISLCIELLADSTKENNQEDTDMFLSKASASVQRMKQLINDLNTAKKAS